MRPDPYRPGNSDRSFYLLAAIGGLVVLVGLWAAHLMETAGHVITGMNNHLVWGTPHVFAIFLVVAASGVLNVASIGTVFGEAIYKPRAPLSGVLSIAMLAGGLMVLMLDLGRPERVVIAATHLIPGPNAVEMAGHVGYCRAGVLGSIVGALCFTD